MKKSSKYLTSAQIYGIYKKYHVPYRVIKHMLKVAEFAADLCDQLIEKGHKVDKTLVVNAALLHDIARVVDFKKMVLEDLRQRITSEDLKTWIALKDKYEEMGHEKAVTKIVKNLGYPEIADLIDKHGFFEIDRLKTLEEKILYYADKRVESDKVVRLKKRFRKGRKRNCKSGDDIKKVKEIERKALELAAYINKLLH